MRDTSQVGRVPNGTDILNVGTIKNNGIHCHVQPYYPTEFSKKILLLNPAWHLEQFATRSGTYENVVNEYGYPVLWDYTHPILNTRISVFYAPVSNVVRKCDLTIFEVYLLIRSEKFKAHTLKLRTIDVKRENTAYKNKYFNSATFSGIFNIHADEGLIKHSNLIVIDLDHLADKLGHVRQKINALEETVMSFISPNGDGFKAVFRIDPLKHTQEQYYEGISKRLATLCGLNQKHLDSSGKNVSRGCFLPYDPSAFLNPNLIPS